MLSDAPTAQASVARLMIFILQPVTKKWYLSKYQFVILKK